jgi:transcriptional regulator with XRE-family HTH domain
VASDAAKRLQLGRELAVARNAAGMTQHRAAAALGCTQSKINKIENTTCLVTSKDLNDLLRLYAPPDDQRERMLLLAAQSGPGPSAGTQVNSEYLKLLALERTATEVLSLHAERIPNLLQSEHYLLMQYQVAGQSVDIAKILQARREREHHLFMSVRPPRYRALFSVSALYRMPGGRTAELVIDQAQHLLALSDWYSDDLSIQVIPWEARLAFLPHDLIVLRFDDSAQNQIYREYGVGESRLHKGKKQVADHIGYWTMVHDAALSVDETRKFLHTLIIEARTW